MSIRALAAWAGWMLGSDLRASQPPARFAPPWPDSSHAPVVAFQRGSLTVLLTFVLTRRLTGAGMSPTANVTSRQPAYAGHLMQQHCRCRAATPPANGRG